MQFHTQKFISTSNSYFQKALKIRETVFVIEQGVNKNLEYQGDAEATHFLLFNGDSPIGTARWRNTEKGIKLERFAILPEYRKKGAGTIILKTVLMDVIPLHKLIYLHAQAGAVSFYQKNGFEIVGEMFLEAGIKHYLMESKTN